MKRALLITLSAGLILGGTSVIMAEETEQIDKSTQPRVIITTDGECDDQNSFRHMLLYANDLDIAGIIYSASSFHWQGDGEHSLAEVNEDYLYKGEDADTLMVYRPQEMGWIESVINDEYAVDYEFLSQNAQGYPAPEELLSKVKVGNVEFEGDLREPSEGSEWIKQCILDDDERPLYIQAWGGFNTTARALLSIAEEYKDTDQWKDIYRKVCKKVRLQARSQDTTYKNVIAELYPNLTELGSANIGYGYFASQQNSAHVLEYFGGEWLSENIKFNHGKMLENYHLIGDGAYYEGELDQYQMGQSTTVQWGSTPREFALYDWVGEGDSPTWIALLNVGLRGLENPNLGTWAGRLYVNGEARNSKKSYAEYNPVTGETDELCWHGRRWLEALQKDFAARADWACNAPEDCNHAPIVHSDVLDLSGAAGETVSLSAAVSDPDGDALHTFWWVYGEACEYSGEFTGFDVWGTHDVTTSFTIPKDAQKGDYFTVILEVTDQSEAPMTRYAEFVVSVI